MDWDTVLFEWDEAKRRSNLDKHGVDFRDVARAMRSGPIVIYDSSRRQEEHHVGIVEISGLLFAVVHT
ncbi:BrnT family toxin [Xanthobacter pseudotagetidis]|uniref:BrnT family toxin n=1 Tax=Xanthobacter pseudotagetidis TaxID=3119911 RepID=UPI00372BEA3B